MCCSKCFLAFTLRRIPLLPHAQTSSDWLNSVQAQLFCLTRFLLAFLFHLCVLLLLFLLIFLLLILAAVIGSSLKIGGGITLRDYGQEKFPLRDLLAGPVRLTGRCQVNVDVRKRGLKLIWKSLGIVALIFHLVYSRHNTIK